MIILHNNSGKGNGSFIVRFLQDSQGLGNINNTILLVTEGITNLGDYYLGDFATWKTTTIQETFCVSCSHWPFFDVLIAIENFHAVVGLLLAEFV